MFWIDDFFSDEERLVRILGNYTHEDLASEYYDLQLCYKALDDSCLSFTGPAFLDWLNWYEQFLLQEIARRYVCQYVEKEPVNYPIFTSKPNTGCPLGGVDVAHDSSADGALGCQNSVSL